MEQQPVPVQSPSSTAPPSAPVPYIPPPKEGKPILRWIVLGLLLAGLSFGIVFMISRFFEGEQQPDGVFREIDVPNIADPVPGDADRDGISDEEEQRLGTSEVEFDTDGDGLADLDEIETWKTDPLNADTDDDGFPDGFEVIKGFNPLGEGLLQS